MVKDLLVRDHNSVIRHKNGIVVGSQLLGDSDQDGGRVDLGLQDRDFVQDILNPGGGRFFRHDPPTKKEPPAGAGGQVT